MIKSPENEFNAEELALITMALLQVNRNDQVVNLLLKIQRIRVMIRLSEEPALLDKLITRMASGDIVE